MHAKLPLFECLVRIKIEMAVAAAWGMVDMYERLPEYFVPCGKVPLCVGNSRFSRGNFSKRFNKSSTSGRALEIAPQRAALNSGAFELFCKRMSSAKIPMPMSVSKTYPRRLWKSRCGMMSIIACSANPAGSERMGFESPVAAPTRM